MANIYVVSDTHFNHRLMINFAKRPFKSTAEMNMKLIKNWNDVVSKKDIVIIIGDFAKGNFFFYRKLLKELNGKKILIKGNHDYMFRLRKLNKTNAIKIYKKIRINIGGKSVLFTHKPLCFRENFFHINIHGHYHRKLLPSELPKGKYWNAAVDHNEFKPKLLGEILKAKNIRDCHRVDFKDILNQIVLHNKINLVFT